MSETVTIAGREYVLASLRMKHLKQIQTMLSSFTGDIVSRLEQYYPFIEFSIKEGGASDFDKSVFEEMTMQDLFELWNKVQTASGVKVTAKGEKKPAEDATGTTSTAG